MRIAAILLALLAQEKPDKWEKEIAAFEKKDAENPPAPGGIVFAGSSTIRMWKLETSFPGVMAINRGFGGSQYSDVLRYADRIILAYKPRLVVLYSGDNDIASGKTPQQVFDDCKAIAAKIHAALPATKILFLPVKSSIKRWSMNDKMLQFNTLVEGLAKSESHVVYVDAAGPSRKEDGSPRPEIFLKDGLHMNEEGYKLWSSIVAPLLKEGK